MRLQSWTKGWRQIDEIKQKRFFVWNALQLIFFDFLPKNVKIWLSVGRLGTRHQIQVFQGFSADFLRSLSRSATLALTFWR